MIIQCPHCEAEIEIEDSEIEYMHKEGYIIDYECPECEMLMDISVEVRWYGEASPVDKDICDECKGSFRTRDMHYKGRCSPWPMKEDLNKLCPHCFKKVLYGELDARRDHLLSLTDEYKKNLRHIYRKGTKIHINQIKSPYHCKRGHNVDVIVKGIKNTCIIECKMPDGTDIDIYPGYDDYEVII